VCCSCFFIIQDPCSNYGNWTYSAGVGTDPREDRYFSVPKQGRVYDAEASFVKHWIPALAKVPMDKAHAPWELNAGDQRAAGCVITQDYPARICPLGRFAPGRQMDDRSHSYRGRGGRGGHGGRDGGMRNAPSSGAGIGGGAGSGGGSGGIPGLPPFGSKSKGKNPDERKASQFGPGKGRRGTTYKA